MWIRRPGEQGVTPKADSLRHGVFDVAEMTRDSGLYDLPED